MDIHRIYCRIYRIYIGYTMDILWRGNKRLSKIDLSGLTSKQREMVRNVVREEWEVFSERER